MATEVTNLARVLAEKGVKIIGFYWTLGRYDTVVIMDAPEEKAAVKANIMVGDIVSTETMVGAPREEVI